MLQISQLYIYPIKSLGGIPLTSAEVTSRGFKYDRRWMLVDEQNHFLTQREHSQMALIKVAVETDGLLVSHHSYGSIKVPFEFDAATLHEVAIWDDITAGVYVSHSIDDWFSNVLGTRCRLIFMPDDTERKVDQRYAQPGMITSFADAYPFLLIGQASLDDLNSRLGDALPMNRFRPNIVFTGGEAFEEDLMNHITIAGISFYGAKLCARCVMTTIDQQTGAKAKEPLKTLARYRSKDKKILFGQNLVHQGEGFLTVGDTLDVLSTHNEDRFIVEKRINNETNRYY
ncbi:MOSC domain-containing protein [Mucilaginibacter ginsenosidivorax]|uniref:MOSC domain-containing protein n=1 Tax=Mucilaginibacter ginsenosidivorax TaxID=862126 RepID=A0A5B8W983_9SPHI|nr:MOSC N-terminal beta barrel domain-containing protein [Mucilaginibacter ginsenosidivorax]QEC80129.1 MOSC domain-containing protein [Mucilaginibacter ginsenosidivorax]